MKNYNYNKFHAIEMLYQPISVYPKRNIDIGKIHCIIYNYYPGDSSGGEESTINGHTYKYCFLKGTIIEFSFYWEALFFTVSQVTSQHAKCDHQMYAHTAW